MGNPHYRRAAGGSGSHRLGDEPHRDLLTAAVLDTKDRRSETEKSGSDWQADNSRGGPVPSIEGYQ